MNTQAGEKVEKNVAPGRRTFINWFLGTSLGALTVTIMYPIARYLSPPEIPEATTNQVEAGPTNDPEFLEKNFKIVRFGLDPVIVVRIGENDFRAWSATCTHLDCIVGYQPEHQRLWCNCHNGAYDLTGKNTAGPPPKPLTPYEVQLIPGGSGQPKTVVVSRS